MLHFFPSTFPDETLYSRLARYHRLSGHHHDRASLRELVGLHTHVITSDLPSQLQRLVSKMPANVRPSVEDIVASNTIFPYFQRFLPPERCSGVVIRMSGTSASGLKAALGLVASRLGGKNPFRFCLQCIEEDRASCGQAYWHRVHQLPGAWVCPRHARALAELDVGTVQRRRHQLFLPDDTPVMQASSQFSLSSCQTEAILRICLLSEAVLSAPQVSWDARNLTDCHRTNANRHGLIQNSGRIRVEELNSILGRYASDFPVSGEYMVLHQHLLDWSLRLLRKPREVAIHPMKHLLLMDCLRSETAVRSECRCPDRRPVTKPAMRHPVDRARVIDVLGQKGKSLRQAAAELGLSVTTLGIEAARLGLPVARRPKILTAKVMSRVRNCLRRGRTPKEVAKEHCLSEVSVYRILRMDEALLMEYTQQLFRQRRDASRKRFMRGTPTQADYTWLRRHDRLWLTEQRAVARKRDVKRELCVDWAARDALLAQQVAQVGNHLRNAAGKPRWISRAGLEHATGLADTIEQNADKLPLTHAALAACAESHADYQSRRLCWAARELDKRLHDPPPRWQLLRQAGIRVLAKRNEQLLATLISH